MSSITLEDVLSQVGEMRKEAVRLIKKLKLSRTNTAIQSSLDLRTSAKSIAQVLQQMLICEQTIFTIGIMKMEVRTIQNSLSGRRLLDKSVKNEFQISLSTIGDCHVLAKQRYDFLSKSLEGMRSINSNNRNLSKINNELGDPRKYK